MPPMEREAAQRLQAFYAQQRGSHGSFAYVLPRSTPLGDLGGDPRVEGTYLAGADVVQTRGWPANRRVLRYGDYIRFSHTKVYQLQQSADSDATGRATLYLAPYLTQTISDGDTIATTAVTFQMSFADDNLDVDLSPHQPTMLYGMGFRLVERY